ncbi:FAD-dependent monooxygenase [Streptomyces sp. NBC_00525]|uniref:FAD-dependent monooxygenase n=1 Tax=Streptomyces sp. NBC_00525 TaxID=2903660 RepID=UPI002E801531|nr:FAD-dependent monooxygenase [Streptomyces sp. NBC_00525]WUC98019.1 FAD-dependent monooxygenase [Streptomyces sp. NBC_00525]
MRGEHPIRAEVLVVGGGPVGMLVAAELAAAGVDTVLLEPRTSVSGQPKATTLHARAVQSLARRGHLPGPARAPYPPEPTSSAFHFAGLPGLTITAPPHEPEPVLKCAQADLERHLEARARAAGARVLRGHRVTGLAQDPAGVRVTAEGPAGPVLCDAGYAVGADGARSTVRTLAGIESDTVPATVSALMGTVTLDDPGDLPKGWHRTPRGWIVAKHTGDGRAHLRTLDCGGPHPDRHRPVTLEELRGEVARIAGRDIAMHSPRWLSRFSDFARLARTFGQGRVFLVGDAAHVHFPIGGQGLSTGVLDALDLGWRLAHAVRGTAGENLLTGYDAERRPLARRVIDGTLAQLALMRQSPEADALRTLFTELLASEDESGRLGGLISAQDTVLPDPTGAGGPAAGTYLTNTALSTPDGDTDVIRLLHDGRPLLLLLGEKSGRHREAARPWAGILHTVEARPVAALPYEAALVRPDGYLAWVPGDGELDRVLAAYFGPGGSGNAAGAPAGRP